MGYITYEEFSSLGGKCPADIFPSLQFDVESKMDYITSGRLSEMISELKETPIEVKMLEVKLVDIEYANTSENNQSSQIGLASYSNGIESFSYDTSKDSETALSEKINALMLEYLYPKYPDLFYRGRVVNVRHSYTS